jgi:hypothetical protein
MRKLNSKAYNIVNKAKMNPQNNAGENLANVIAPVMPQRPRKPRYNRAPVRNPAVARELFPDFALQR